MTSSPGTGDSPRAAASGAGETARTLTVVILTMNEERNISECIASARTALASWLLAPVPASCNDR
jgi:hypothetical protein